MNGSMQHNTVWRQINNTMWCETPTPCGVKKNTMWCETPTHLLSRSSTASSAKLSSSMSSTAPVRMATTNTPSTHSKGADALAAADCSCSRSCAAWSRCGPAGKAATALAARWAAADGGSCWCGGSMVASSQHGSAVNAFQVLENCAHADARSL